MRIEYEFETKKELRHYLNRALGVAAQKRKIVKNMTKRPKTFTQLCIINYLLCLIDFFIFYTLFTFDYENLATLLFFIVLFIMIVTTFSLFNYFIKCLRINDLKGEISFNEDGVIDITESGRTIKQPWHKIKFVYINDDVIYILTTRCVFFCTYSVNNLEVVNKAIEQYKPNLKIIESKFLE